MVVKTHVSFEQPCDVVKRMTAAVASVVEVSFGDSLRAEDEGFGAAPSLC